MDDTRASDPAKLYEDDFYVWTQDQAERLRRAGEQGALPASLDWTHMAEEIEDMGKRDQRAARKLTRRIIEHLICLAVSCRTEPRAGWRTEVAAFRADLRDDLTAAIRNSVEADLPALHAAAFDVVQVKFQAHEPDALPLDASLRWSMAQVLGEGDDDPLLDADGPHGA